MCLPCTTMQPVLRELKRKKGQHFKRISREKSNKHGSYYQITIPLLITTNHSSDNRLRFHCDIKRRARRSFSFEKHSCLPSTAQMWSWQSVKIAWVRASGIWKANNPNIRWSSQILCQRQHLSPNACEAPATKIRFQKSPFPFRRKRRKTFLSTLGFSFCFHLSTLMRFHSKTYTFCCVLVFRPYQNAPKRW